MFGALNGGDLRSAVDGDRLKKKKMHSFIELQYLKKGLFKT